MSAPVTEAHRRLASIILHPAVTAESAAQRIADSEEKATQAANIRANNAEARVAFLETAYDGASASERMTLAELAKARARLDWLTMNAQVYLEEYREGSRSEGGTPWYCWKFSSPRHSGDHASAAIDAAEAGGRKMPPDHFRGVTKKMPLADDIARCDGVSSTEGGMRYWREGCENCLRRTAPRSANVPMIAPPAIIVFECEFLIEEGKK